LGRADAFAALLVPELELKRDRLVGFRAQFKRTGDCEPCLRELRVRIAGLGTA